MKLTTQQIRDAHAVLGIVGSRNDLTGRVAYHIGRNIKKLNPELETLEETRKKVFDQYRGEPTVGEDGKQVPESDDVVREKPEFIAAWKELMATECELDVTTVSLFETIYAGRKLDEPREFMPAMFTLLDWMFVDDLDEKLAAAKAEEKEKEKKK